MHVRLLLFGRRNVCLGINKPNRTKLAHEMTATRHKEKIRKSTNAGDRSHHPTRAYASSNQRHYRQTVQSVIESVGLPICLFVRPYVRKSSKIGKALRKCRSQVSLWQFDELFFAIQCIRCKIK